MTGNERLMELAKEAIENLFNDQSVSPEVAVENLTELIDDLEIRRESLA